MGVVLYVIYVLILLYGLKELAMTAVDMFKDMRIAGKKVKLGELKSTFDDKTVLKTFVYYLGYALTFIVVLLSLEVFVTVFEYTEIPSMLATGFLSIVVIMAFRMMSKLMGIRTMHREV